MGIDFTDSAQTINFVHGLEQLHERTLAVRFRKLEVRTQLP
jgi:hypothetical protein